MNIENDKSIIINGNRYEFEYSISKSLKFNNYTVVLLIGDIIPDDNIYIIDGIKNQMVNISHIIKVKYPEGYVSIAKESDGILSAISFAGVMYLVDMNSLNVISREITK